VNRTAHWPVPDHGRIGWSPRPREQSPHTTSAPPTETSTGSLTQPITIAGGGKNYMNISFDGCCSCWIERTRSVTTSKWAITIQQQRGFKRTVISSSLRWRSRSLLRRFRQHRLQTRQRHTEPRSKSREAFMQNNQPAVRFAIKGRSVLRRLRPHQSDASAHRGFCR